MCTVIYTKFTGLCQTTNHTKQWTAYAQSEVKPPDEIKNWLQIWPNFFTTYLHDTVLPIFFMVIGLKKQCKKGPGQMALNGLLHCWLHFNKTVTTC